MNDDELISPLTPEELSINTSVKQSLKFYYFDKVDTLVKMIASPENLIAPYTTWILHILQA
jgi:hypothetical protein